MNRLIFPTLLFFGLAAGCASQASPPQWFQPLARDQQPADSPAAEAIVATAQFSPPASALIFDLPIARDIPLLDLDRASREPGAFIGFEGPSAEYHTVLINNSQNAGNGFGYGSNNGEFGDSYQRQDLIQRTSVRYR